MNKASQLQKAVVLAGCVPSADQSLPKRLPHVTSMALWGLWAAGALVRKNQLRILQSTCLQACAVCSFSHAVSDSLWFQFHDRRGTHKLLFRICWATRAPDTARGTCATVMIWSQNCCAPLRIMRTMKFQTPSSYPAMSLGLPEGTSLIRGFWLSEDKSLDQPLFKDNHIRTCACLNIMVFRT